MDERRLGVGLESFFYYRSFPHLVGWLIALTAACFLWVFLGINSGNGWQDAIAALLITFALFVAYAFAAAMILPALPLMLLACVSIYIEARWRIKAGCPFVPPPEPPAQSVAPNPPPPERSSSLLPLLIGLWIGSSWGKDDY